MKRFYVLFIFSIFSYLIQAQPVNDDCGNATLLTDVVKYCENFDSDMYTYDAAGSACGPNLSPPNMWYSFVAVGSILDLNVSTPAGTEVAIINIYSVDPSDACNTLTNIFCTETGIINNLTGLVTGNTYYVSVAFTDAGGASVSPTFELCITNGDPQLNNDPCQSVPLTMGVCELMESNILASPDILFQPLCPGAWSSQLWYTVDLDPENHILDVEINPSGTDPLTGDVFVSVGQFESGCMGGFAFLDFYCGPANTPIEFFGLNPDVQYFLVVATNQENEGEFNLCPNQRGEDGCVLNDNSDDCGLGVPVIAPVIPGGAVNFSPFICETYCIDNASPVFDYSIAGTCGFDLNNSTVWFQVQTGPLAQFMNIDIAGTTMTFPGVAVFSGDCMNPTLIQCNAATGSDLSLTDIPVNASSSYWVAVTSLDANSGSFNLCINTFFPINPCNNSFSLAEVSSSIDDSPVGGPYCPGEEVEFCFDILSYDASQAGSGCQWLQAIVPSFGDGWDPSSFGADGEPVNVQRPTTLHAGQWSWYPDDDVDYNLNNPNIHVISGAHGLSLCSPIQNPSCVGTPLAPGVGLPGGWYAVSPDGNPPDDHPDVAFGDGSGCGNSNDGPWQVCFTLTARMHPDCEAQDSYNEASVSVVAFPDGETGSWNNPTCLGVIPDPITAFIDCSAVPDIQADNAEICSGQTFVVTLTSPQDPLVYEWTVDAPPAITGESDGTGPVISQTLTNNSSDPIDVIYSVIGKKTSCPGLADVTVTVYPEIDVVPINQPVMGCALQTFALGNYIQVNGGKPPYEYSWSNGSMSNNPQVQVNADATFMVTVTDEVGCSGVGIVDLEIFGVFDVDIDGPTQICASEGSATLTATPLGGVSPFMTFDWQLPDGTQMLNAGDMIDADQTGTYLVTVKDAGDCPGTGEFEFTVNENPESNIIAFPEGAICQGSTTQLFEDVMVGSSANFTTSWITPPGFTGDVTIPGFETDVPGDYTLIVLDDNGCTDSFTLTLDVQPAPEAFPATIEICHDASGTGTFDLTTAENQINNGTGFDVDFFEDIDLANQISVLDVGAYQSAPGIIYAVVFNAADCPSPTVEVTLAFAPEIASEDAEQTVCLEASGLGTFDLTALIDVINGGTALPVEFYEDSDGTINITNPGSYQAAAGTVYAQVDGQNGCFSGFAEIDLATDTLLEAFDASLSTCRTIDNTGVFDLTTQNSTITNGQPLQVIWYSNSTPPLVTITDPTNYETGASSVFATVSDGQCIANVVEVDLTLTTGASGNETTIDECNRGDDTGRFDLTASDGTVGGGNTVHWYSDAAATNAIADPTDFESGETSVYAVVEDANRCVSDPIEVVLNLEYLDITDIDSIKTCDPGTGIGTFDLTSLDAVINDGTGWTVEWFEDAAGTMAISNPSSYDSDTKFVYARVVDGECVSLPIDVQLAVTNDLAGVPITITECDQGNGRHAFDLTDSDIAVSPDGLAVEYYTDAGATIPVPDATNFVSGNATIYAIVRDGVCRSPIVQIDLEVQIEVFPPEETAVECDQGGGQGTFDLTSYEALITGAGGTVMWFEDAAGTIPVANPASVVTNPRDVYARVTDADGCISDITVFHLDTDNNLPAFPTAAEACDDGLGMGIFNLELLINTISGGNPFDVEFYLDQNLTNEITGPDVFGSGNATVYAITIDGPCQSVPVEIDLSLIPQIMATPASDDLCDEGSGMATFDLTTLEAGINNGQTHSVIWYVDQALTMPITNVDAYLTTGVSVWAVLSNGNCESEPVEVQLDVTTVTGNIESLETCDEGAGTGTFDLVSLESSIVTDGSHTVSWYEDVSLVTAIASASGYVSAGGTVYAVVTDGRCDSEPVEVQLTLTDKLPAEVIPISACDDGDGRLVFNLNDREAEINTLGSGDVIWYEDADGTAVIANETNYESGTNTVYAQVVDGPCRSDIIAISLTVDPLPTIDAGLEQQLDCRSAFIDIIGMAPAGDYTYQWTTTDGNIVSGEDQLTVRVDQPGVYTLEVINTITMCSQTDEVRITEDVDLPVADAGLDKAIDCVDETTEIGTTATSTGPDINISWTLDNQPISGSSPTLAVSEPGTYVVTVENTVSGCTNMDEVIVTSSIAELSDLIVDIDNPNCNGANTGCLTFLSVTGGEGPYVISADDVNFVGGNEICNLGAGDYTFTVRDINGCFISEVYTIEQPEVLMVQIVGNNIIDYKDSTSLAAVHTPTDVIISSYDWLSDNHFVTVIDSVVGATGLEEFPVSVTITDENGCTATDNIIVYVRKNFNVFAPSAFSPNKRDNINDRFYLYGDEEIVTNVNVFRIYSRWGEKLYERENLAINAASDGWDGTFEGQRMMPGTYAFYAEVTYVDGQTELISGEFILVD